MSRLRPSAAVAQRVREWPPWACPEDLTPLLHRDGSLSCERGHLFPIVRGIPRFVSGRTYSDAFGLQWNRFRLTQLDSRTGTTISRDRARRALGDELWESLDGGHVLECGCGAGRFTEVLLERGARVTSVDLSDAVDANQENFPEGLAHRVAQADIRALPFAPRQFDVVFCLGVVQHTPSPEETIAALYEQVRPGGSLVFDHYARRLGWMLSLAPVFRLVLRRLPRERALAVTDGLVRILLPLHRRAGPAEPLLRRVSPVHSYHRDFAELGDELQLEWARLDTHDSLTDRYKHFRGAAELGRTLNALGAQDVVVREAGNGVEARARRPPGG